MPIRTLRSPFHRESWNIGSISKPITALLESGSRPEVRWFPPPKRGKFLADPFGLSIDERVCILCEEFDRKERKGRIVSIEFGKEGSVSPPSVAIDLPVHVSYPYLVQYDGDIFCIPETAQAGEIAIYKADDFPNRWRKIAVLVNNFAGHDPTVFQYGGLWWLACTGENLGQQSDLFLWHASKLLGPWVPHLANPVKRDSASSRSAGTPFTYKEHLYRPAQDCSRTYGGRIILNRIETLTDREFKEQPVAVIEPYRKGPYPDGVHTVSAVGNLTFVDGKRYVLVRSAFSDAFSRRVAKLRGPLGT
jgi:hypothetical protein